MEKSRELVSPAFSACPAVACGHADVHLHSYFFKIEIHCWEI